MSEKLRQYFFDMCVYKDPLRSNFFKALSLPSFLRDWILRRFEDDDGEYDAVTVGAFVKQYCPPPSDWTAIKSRLVSDGEDVKLLTRIVPDVNIRTGGLSFSLPSYGLGNGSTSISQSVWDATKHDLLNGREAWGVVTLGYQPPKSEKTGDGKILLADFQTFCPYEADVDYYREARSHFDIHEWIDILLGAVDYNAAGYADECEKLTVLSRLMPFCEKRLNLIELAPKGTAKSYMFGSLSRYGWLGNMSTRAKMFYDMAAHCEGAVCHHDFVAIDECQSLGFRSSSELDELRGAFKSYMESGVFSVGNFTGTSDAGVVMLGNVDSSLMSEYADLFNSLPEFFHESALIDRFHGLIKGWNVPRMHDSLKVNGWALNTEYFCTILHSLRDDGLYRNLVEQLIVVPEKADTRDTEAVKRLCTAFMKLLFPHVTTLGDVPRMMTLQDFELYCLRPAVNMRQSIRIQLGKMDAEFKNTPMPAYALISL